MSTCRGTLTRPECHIIFSGDRMPWRSPKVEVGWSFGKIGNQLSVGWHVCERGGYRTGKGLKTH
eukprot:5463583-Pyramimonas_sp.AAC.1